jgi:Ser/Thr protein kinase RdoA (MazF antagonist)
MVNRVAQSIRRGAKSALRHGLRLCLTFVGAVFHQQTAVLVSEAFAGARPSTTPTGHVVVSLQGSLPSAPRVARVYDCQNMSKGVRHVCIKAVISRQNIRVPATRGYGCVHIAGQRYFAVVEDRVPGEHPKKWSEPLAFQLGQDLARWHSLHVPVFLAAALALPRHLPKVYRRQGAKRLELIQAPIDSLRAQLRESLKGLEGASFRGRAAMSHGDLHPRNILFSTDERLIWLDFDGACLRPVRHDLALAQLVLLQSSPQTVDAFEEGYFDLHPAERCGWRLHRLGWYRIVCALRALQLLTPRKRRPTMGRREQLHLAMSSSAWEVKDVGQASSALVASILGLARRTLAYAAPETAAPKTESRRSA